MNMEKTCENTFNSLGDCVSSDPFGAEHITSAGIDLNQLSVKSCLICLRLDGIISIYDASETTSLSFKIKSLADITVTKDIGFPSSVCSVCADNVNNAYQLRKQCQNSFKIFSNFVKINIPFIHCVKANTSCMTNDPTNPNEMEKIPPDLFCSVYLPEPNLINENKILQNTEIKEESDDCLYKNTRIEEDIATSNVKSEPIDISIDISEVINEPLFIENFAYKCEFSMREEVEVNVEKRFVSQDENFISNKSIITNINANDSDEFVWDDDKYYEGEKYPESLEAIRIPENDDPKCICEICGKTLKTLSILHNHLKLHESKIFECDKCNKIFATSYLMRRHSKIHNHRNRHKCDQCDKTFATKTTLNVHKKCVHLGIKKFQCVICGKKMNSGHYKLHLRFHTGEKPYNCDKCDEKFYSRYLLNKHSVKHSNDGQTFDINNLQANENNQQISKATDVKRYKCPTCERDFGTKWSLRSHITIHTGEKPHKCSYCSNTYRLLADKLIHERIHTGEKPYSCKQCDSKFRHRINLLKHVEKIHLKKQTVKLKSYKCPTCNKSFSRSDSLRTHIKIHTGEKSYKCSTCSESFRVLAEKIIHERRHLGSATPYQCSICQKYFNNSGHLNAHLRMHSGEKPFDCPNCDKKFSTSWNLRNHITIHTGEKPHSCTHCHAEFRLRKSLQKHVKKNHLKEAA